MFKNREEDHSLLDKIRAMKGFISGKLFNAKVSLVGNTILKVYEENITKMKEEGLKRSYTVAATYQKQINEANDVLTTGTMSKNMSNA